MIIKEAKSNIISVGDIQQNKVSIDPKNLEFITTLLSSNLYSNPEESFMREIVSNAWDSHIEAGTEDKAVIIKIDRDWITIRDYGVGLSPERFQEIYLNIGSSTKRDTNTQIGGFGIGRMSALACSNTCHITSFYEGKKYYYIMAKDGNSINIDLLNTSDTDEDNGLSVSIKVDSPSEYLNNLSSLVFFPNIYIENKSNYYCIPINNNKIKKFKYFAYSSIAIFRKILLGNVLYPLDDLLLGEKYRTLIKDFFSEYRTAIQFDIGELPVTPNREAILYNKQSIALIEKRIEQAVYEKCSIIANAYNKDYSDALEFATNNSKYWMSFDFITCTFNPKDSNGYDINHSSLKEYLFSHGLYDVKIKGKKLTEKDVKTIAEDFYMYRYQKVPGLAGYVGNDIVYTSKVPYKYQHATEFMDIKDVVLIPKDLRITANIRKYFISEYKYHTILRDITKDEFIQIADNKNSKSIILSDSYIHVHKIGKVFNPDSQHFKDFVQDIKDEAANRKKLGKTITNEMVYISVRFADKRYYKSGMYNDFSKFAKDFNIERPKNTAAVVVNPRYEYLNVLEELANIKDFNIINVPKQYINKLEGIVGRVDETKLLDFNNPFIKSLYTFYNEAYYKIGPVYTDCANFKQYLSADVLEALGTYQKYYNFLENNYYLRMFIKAIPTDRENHEGILNVIKLVENTKNNIIEFKDNLVSAGIHYGGDACTFFIMKKKLFRIPYNVYKKMKSNPLFNNSYENIENK